MPVTRLDDNARIEARRGDVVVCVRSDGASADRLDACLASVEAHTPGEVAVIVADGPQIFELTAPADVVLLSADAVVAEGWLEGLRDAAYYDSRVATASAIASGELPERIERERRGGSGAFAFTAAAPATRIARTVRARMFVAPPSSLPEIRWKLRLPERCLEAGLCHVLADDVLVGAPVASPPTSAMPRVRRGRCAALAARSRACR